MRSQVVGPTAPKDSSAALFNIPNRGSRAGVLQACATNELDHAKQARSEEQACAVNGIHLEDVARAAVGAARFLQELHGDAYGRESRIPSPTGRDLSPLTAPHTSSLMCDGVSGNATLLV
jgi:hypothetical protein